MRKLVLTCIGVSRDNYATAKDTVWDSWRDSDIRTWLVENNYVKSQEKASKMTRKELVTLINNK